MNNVWASLFLLMTEKLKAASFKDRQEWSKWILLFWGQFFLTYNAELCSLLVQLLSAHKTLCGLSALSLEVQLAEV